MNAHNPRAATNLRQFPTGFGQSDTRASTLHDGRPNPSPRAGEPYSTIDSPSIVRLLAEPQSVPKDRARWFIPSTYAEADARSHAAQRERGEFWFLTLDVDDNDIALADVAAALGAVAPGVSQLIYSTRSSTAAARRWRALLPLAVALPGKDYAETLAAFYDLLEQETDGVLIPCRGLLGTAQPVYLPNRGEHYEHRIAGAARVCLDEAHPIILRREDTRRKRAETEAEAREWKARKAWKAKHSPTDTTNIIEAFNADHSIADMLDRHGYARAGSSSNYRSPFQTSGSYATRDYDSHWISLSASDASEGLGRDSKTGARFGNAFDLFVHFEHNRDFKAAVRAYAEETGQDYRSRGKTAKEERKNSAGNQDSAEDQGEKQSDEGGNQDEGKARSFEELLAAARALGPDDIDQVEAICAEASLLTPLRRDQVLKAISAATGMTLTSLREQAKGGRASDEPDHLDLARLTLGGIGQDNILCADQLVWRWSGTGVWKQHDDRAIKQDVQKALEEAEADVTAPRVNGVADVLKTAIYRREHQFNLGNPETVNCLNGEVELDGESWTLKPHRREHYRTTQIPVEYDPNTESPMFRQFLSQIFRDDPDRDQKIQAVLELIGYSLMSHANHEKFVMLIGPGANGKSVLLVVLEALLGCENVAGVQPANFDRSFQRAHLHQKLANIVTELKQGEVIADAELKAITSGEPSTVEHKFKDPFVMRPFATCWFGTNHMPHTRDFSEALFRRATILTFNRTFELHEQDTKLKDKRHWAPELPGILNMALAAYGRAIVSGFTFPSSSDAAKREWRLEADQAAQFVEDACVAEASSSEKASDVYLAYQSWALANGIGKTMSAKGLRDRLTRLGFGSRRDMHGRYVTGLRLITKVWYDAS